VADEEADGSVALVEMQAKARVKGGALAAVEQAIIEEEARKELGFQDRAVAVEEDEDEATDADELEIENDAELNDAVAEAEADEDVFEEESEDSADA